MTVRRTSGARQSPFSREGDLGFLTSILSPLTSDPPRERSERLDDALSLHSPTIFCPRSGTGATQSYWHREAILAAAGDWRFFITLHAPRFSRGLSRGISLSALTDNPQRTTYNGSQEYTPRQQEHAATPLPEGILDQKRKRGVSKLFSEGGRRRTGLEFGV